MDIETMKNKLRGYGIKPNFTFGQNFLMDEIVLEDIIDSSGITNEDAVLEIGPGICNLTERLCSGAKFVLAIDKDPKFLPILHSLKKENKNLRFEIADALEFNFQDFIKSQGFNSYKVVANIPYYITGKILQMLMTAKFKPTSITILTQKEVAINLSARPGDLSILAISVQLFGEPKLIQVVPARSFYPAPKVDSAVVQINLFKEPKYKIKDEKKFFKIIKACFSGKRKQIHNTLVNNLHLEKPFALKILNDIKIKPEARPQELTIENWIELVKKIETIETK
jgi:16S rRNA (adenine1518-N6/adenine1519-N6)-dimethyltransferase